MKIRAFFSKQIKKPSIRIGSALILLLLSCEICNYFLNGHPGTFLLLIPLGSLVGPAMFLLYPFSIMGKLLYVLALVSSLALIAVGIIRRNNIWGQVVIVLGVVMWAFCGMLGLGTGS